MVPSPFSPTGFVPVPPETPAAGTTKAAPAVAPNDIAGAARTILSRGFPR